MVYSKLLGREVDDSSEEWRHECECRWLLDHKQNRSQKHLWLYGVKDRSIVVNLITGVLRDNYKDLLGAKKNILTARGLAAADKILADAKKLYDMENEDIVHKLIKLG